MNNLYLIHSPRSGSTAVFLAIVHATRAFFIPNALPSSEAESFGSFIRDNRNNLDFRLNLSNRFGKTRGLWRPSEGSTVFSHYFGGNHPSELKSIAFLRGKEHQFRTQLGILEATGKMFLSKNAWNSFRISALKDADPRAKFLWIRRDIFDSSVSELHSRQHFGDLHRWSSATPSNLVELRKLRPAAQALGQAVAYANAIERQFSKLDDSDFATVWFEDFRADPGSTILQLALKLQLNITNPTDLNSLKAELRHHPRPPISDESLRREIRFIRQVASHDPAYAVHVRETNPIGLQSSPKS